MIEFLLMITILCFFSVHHLLCHWLINFSMIRKVVKVNSGFNINFIHFYGCYACV